ncbi:hypothetical protein [Haloferax sp. YSMS24]|uniref:hypothetical protein n=1 Tax=Haloferax sp. YSMS24 TaxID=3388425 RepID=UPI00398D25A0
MVASGVSVATLRVYRRVAPIGRPLAGACLGVGYVAIALGFFAPNLLNSVLGFVPESVVLQTAYFVTFAYPAAYVVLALLAAYGAVNERVDDNWSRRDRVHVYLAIAFAEWTLHHLLYVQFPLALIWGYLSLSMGVRYAIPVWGLLGVAVVGVLVGNRYLWYHDPDDLPVGAFR